MKQKYLIVLLALIAIAAITFYLDQSNKSEEGASLLENYTEVQTFLGDTTLTEPLVVGEGDSVVVEDGAKIVAEAPVVIEGAIGCRNGVLNLHTKSSLEIKGAIICDEGDSGDISIVAEGGITMASDAEIVASGNVQLVDAVDKLRDANGLNALYDEVETIPNSGVYVGPFVAEESNLLADDTDNNTFRSQNWMISLIDVAHAQVDNGTTTVNLAAEPIIVSGKIKVGTPREGVKRIVVFDFPNTPEVTITDFELEGPDGRAGEADSRVCDVVGKNGGDAFRFNAFAPSLKVNNFTLKLGDGGEGGEATTASDCVEAKAKGGKGGKPGNFRMIGSQNFEITGAFMIHPGNGGAGGGATATGGQGDPGEKGGDAHATGGDGADNKKKLTVSGTVAGTSNVQFGDAVGGLGGSALAEGGKGGDANKCGMTGGAGGKAIAKSGNGGDAKLSVSGGAERMEYANDIGGKGGVVEAYGGAGGNGGSCDETAKGGDGGRGGDADASEGKGGLGKTGRASDGSVLGDDGGDGGNGGDGCTEGSGGEGGSGGIEDGELGEDGQNICITVTKEEDYVSLMPGEVQVIKHMDYYIPIANLAKFTDPDGEECDGDEHWHPGAGGAINLRGMAVPDPDPNNCGFGKTSEVPVLVVEDPNYQQSDTEAEVQGGGMIQIDPPTLVIPAGQAQ